MTPEHIEKLASTLFRLVWYALADKNKCDTWGSAEQRRVLAEWLQADCPLPLVEFIQRRANASPEVKP